MSGLKVPRKTLFKDMIAGLVMSIITVPGSIANGVLAGVNPIYGLYSTIFGTTVAALFTSSVIMNVDTTGATALAAGGILSGKAPEVHLEYLVVLVILVGMYQLIFGLLKLGDLTDFISNSVMTGFIAGVAIQAIIGQVGDITGYYSEVPNKILRVLDTLLNISMIDVATLGIGLLTILLILGVERTRFARFAYIIALAVSTLAVQVLGLDSVILVGDTTDIPQAIPKPNLPTLSLVFEMIIPAFAIAIIGLVQSAGVSQSVPNPDGKYPDPSGDFRGQGIANLVTGFFGGLPVGGSLSGTALLRSIGGRTRWGNIFTGLFSLMIVLLFANLIELLPLTAIAGLIVVVGFSLINVPRIQTAWHTGPASATIMLITFVGTLLMPIHYAVFLGVLLHILLYAFQSAEAVRVECVIPQEDNTYIEAQVPKELPSNDVVILQPIGSLFFAGAAKLEDQLPEVGQAKGSVVILRLRDRDEVGSTFIRIVERYVRALQAQDNLLMLSGLNKHVLEQLEKTDLLELIGEENVFPAEARFGAAVDKAVRAAETWMGKE
ncbi:MAG: SulP family inorganic anion transporter [Anaerolineales bacterium]|jgi:SulP family sulfate permease